VGTLDLHTGSIAQRCAGDGMNDLWITTYLGFLGGALNSTATLGTVHITGSEGFAATANLAPQTTAITIGSTISLEGIGGEEGGSGMRISTGDYSIKNGADFLTGAFCSTEVGWLNQIPLPPINPYETSKVNFFITAVPNGSKAYSNFTTGEGEYCNFIRDYTGSVKLRISGSMSIATGVTYPFSDTSCEPPNHTTTLRSIRGSNAANA